MISRKIHAHFPPYDLYVLFLSLAHSNLPTESKLHFDTWKQASVFSCVCDQCGSNDIAKASLSVCVPLNIKLSYSWSVVLS